MRYAVAVPSFKSTKQLLLVISAIERSVKRAKGHECLAVIIVDYGSSSEVIRGVRKVHECKVIVHRLAEDKGLPLMRNLGYILSARLGAEAVIFVDNDVLPSENTFRVLLDSLDKHPMLGAVDACLKDLKGGGRVGALLDVSMYSLTLKRRALRRLVDDVRLTAYASGAIFAVRMSALRAIGGFSFEFPFWFDDVDFSLRMVRAGYLVGTYTEECALHIHGFSRRSLNPKLRAEKEVADSMADRLRAIVRFMPPKLLILGIYLALLDLARLLAASVARRSDPVERLKAYMGVKGLLKGLTQARRVARLPLTGSTVSEALALKIIRKTLKLRIIKNLGFMDL
jgi:GT2 family glycosyltransferase